MERVSRNRAVAILLLFATVLGLFGFRMYGLQIRDADPNSSLESTYTTWSRVTAARGEILDRNGNVLVTNRASYNLVFNNYVIYNSDHPNEALRKLVNLLQEREISYLEHLPVTLEKPYEYTLSQLSSTWQGYFKDFLSYREWDSDISAAQLMKQLRQCLFSIYIRTVNGRFLRHQNQFLCAVCHKGFCLLHQIIHWVASVISTDFWNNAVGTVLVAPFRNL